MGNGPACATCRTALRWIPESSAWGCDRCRMLYPVRGPGPGPGPAPRRPVFRNPRVPLYLGIGAAAVAAVALTVVLAVSHGDQPGSGSAKAVITGALSAIAAGDVDALVALADPEGMASIGMDCSRGKRDDDLASDRQIKRLRADFADLVAKAKGLAVELVDSEELDDDHDLSVRSGDDIGGCVAITTIHAHRYAATVRVTAKDGKRREQKATAKLMEVDGRWFLVEAPAIKPPGVVDALLSEMADFKDQMCACKDKPCADRVNADWNRWTQDMSKLAGIEDKPDEEAMKQLTDLMQQFMACQMKL